MYTHTSKEGISDIFLSLFFLLKTLFAKVISNWRIIDYNVEVEKAGVIS